MAFGLDYPDKQRAALIGLLVLGSVYAFLQYLWKPVHEERLIGEERLAEVDGYNDQARALTQPRRVDDLERREAEHQVTLAAYETMLSSETEVAGLLAEVATAAAQNEVSIVDFAPLEAIAGENLMEFPFDLQLQGGYHDIGRFLSEIAGLPRLVRPSILAIEQLPFEDEAQGEAYGVLVTLRLSTFVPVGPRRTLRSTRDALAPAGSVAAHEERIARYDDGGRRDPFTPMFSWVTAGASPTRFELLRLTGIFQGSASNGLVVLEDPSRRGHFLRLGQQVGNARLVEILPQAAAFDVLDYGASRRVVLRLEGSGDSR